MPGRRALRAKAAAAFVLAVGSAHAAPAPGDPWLDPHRSPTERAALALAAMTLDEKIELLHGPSPLDLARPGYRPSDRAREALPGAGFVPGVPRLGIPNLYETDASLGIANPREARPHDGATALPAGLALAATFDAQLAYRAGALVGSEARAKGFNVLLGPGMNLTRDPRNGRNFEYLGEDPLLAGVMAGAAVRGIQDQHVIATLKHFVLNANETNRAQLDARIDPAALRESDLLAFELAIERGAPGAVMCAYNKVNGAYACGNEWLLDQVLKRDWRYPGWVMSDWGAVHGVDDALSGLDQESGEQFDRSVWFDAPLKAAVLAATVPRARIDAMAFRILRSMFAVGLIEHPPSKSDIDDPAHRAVALEIAQRGIALLKNEGALLPLARNLRRVAVIGGYADLGVLSGGGSAQVLPAGGSFIKIPAGPHGETVRSPTAIFDASSPYQALKRELPDATVSFDRGEYPAAAAAAAAQADVAIVFAVRHELEGYDIPDLQLPAAQDALIEAVAAANPHTVVVLETGNPVAMPWLDRVAAVLAAWYPGEEGGQAIAEVVLGKVNPSARLPISFPKRIEDWVRPALPNLGSAPGAPVSIEYAEGAAVGYRWYAARGIAPLFAFGHGLSYTRFEYGRLRLSGGKTLNARFVVRNVGARAGADVPQLYLTEAAGQPLLRLVGFARVELGAGESRELAMRVDRRLLASFDATRGEWDLRAGRYGVRIGRSASELTIGAGAGIMAAHLPP